MEIYAGFSTIPIVGPVLGVAGAAAAVAFGSEQLAKVNSANLGGIIPGAGPNQDSVLSYLTPGEFVVPRQNYNEVVDAVADKRAGGGGSEFGGMSGSARILIGFEPEAARYLTIKQNENRALGISLETV
jgi:hypothetical protein